jgi:hypothetical protein
MICTIIRLIRLKKEIEALQERDAALAGFPGIWNKWAEVRKAMRRIKGRNSTMGDCVKSGLITPQEAKFILSRQS